MSVTLAEVLGREIVFRESRILPRSRDSIRPRMYMAGHRYELYGVWLSDAFRQEGHEEFVCLLRAEGAHLIAPWCFVQRDAELAS